MNILITGGLGFIGVNAAQYFDALGHAVSVIDNYYRPGVRDNEKWLREASPKVRISQLDIRDSVRLRSYVTLGKFDVILHCAAQTAVTTSVEAPRYDFETNASGTFNVMEAARAYGCAVIYASTNKVYGALSGISLWQEDKRWRFTQKELMLHGLDENTPLDPISPYGCSKLSGEHYVRDYARIYGVKTVSLRQSCIYGPRQLGGTDQGWLTWFTRAWMQGDPVTIFGDGKQVRDVLHIDDLLRAYEFAIRNIDNISGDVFNIGGGPENAVSIWWELMPIMSEITGRQAPPVTFADWRPGDQKVHVTDNRKLKQVLGWTPRVSIKQGLETLTYWMSNNAIGKKIKAA